jgi:hypothetical protein
MLSSFTTGGSFEATGFGYGPGIGEGYEQLVMIVATILFLIVGVGLIGFGTINVYKNMKKNQSTDKDRNEE